MSRICCLLLFNILFLTEIFADDIKPGCMQQDDEIFCYSVTLPQFRYFIKNRLKDGYENLAFSVCNFGKLPLGWIPDDVAENITYLSFYDVNLGKIHPEAFNYFTNLKTFKMDSSQIDTLPTGVFKNMDQLTLLSITSTTIDNLRPKVFVNLPKVEQIQLGQSTIGTWKTGMFQNLSSLTAVGAENCGLTFVSPNSFINTPAVTTVDIAWNSLPSFSHPVFNNLPELSTLYLSDNNIKSLSPNIFSKMKSVDGVYLGINYLIDLPIFENVDQVNSVSVYQNKLTNLNWLSAFRNAETLNANYNQITNFDVTIFNSTTSLTVVGLKYNKLTNLDVLKLADVLPTLTIALEGNPWDCNNLNQMLDDASHTEINFKWGTTNYNVPNINGIPCINNSLL